MATKTVYTVTRPFFIVAANGDHREVSVGTVLKAKEYNALTPQKKDKVTVTEVEGRVRGTRRPVDDSPEGLLRREQRRERRRLRREKRRAAEAALAAVCAG